MIQKKYFIILAFIGALFASCGNNQQIDKIVVNDLKLQKEVEYVLKTDTSITLEPNNKYEFDIFLKDIKYNKTAFLHIQNSANKDILFTYPMNSIGLNGRYTVDFFAPEINKPKEYFIFWVGDLSDKPDYNVYSIVISGEVSNNIPLTAATNTNAAEITQTVSAKTTNFTEQKKVEKPAASEVKIQPIHKTIQPKGGFYITSVSCINATKGGTESTGMWDNCEYKFRIGVEKSGKGIITTLTVLKDNTSYADIDLTKGKGYYMTDSPQKFEPGKYTFRVIDDNDNQSKGFFVICKDSEATGPLINISPSDTAIYNFISGKNYKFRCEISDPSGVSKAEIKLDDGFQDQTFPLERNRDNYWEAKNIQFNENATSVKATVTAWHNDINWPGHESQSVKSFTINKSFYLTNMITIIENKLPAKNITLLIQRQGISKNEIKKTDDNGEFYLTGLNGEKIEFWQDSDSTKIFSVTIKKDQDNLKFELKSAPIEPKLTLNFTILDKSILKTPFQLKFTAYVIPKPDKIIKFSEETADQLKNAFKYETTIDSKQITDALTGNKAKITVNTFFNKQSGLLYQNGNYSWAYHVTVLGNDNVSVEGNSQRFGMVNFPIEAVNAPEIALNAEDTGIEELKQ